MAPQFEVSKTTLGLLKNFARISNSVLLTEGRIQKTMASGKSVLAIAEFPEAWPKETGIYDLSSYLGTLSLFDKPGIEFADEAFIISEGKSRIKYRYSDPSTIQTPPNKELATANPSVTFTLPSDLLARIKKTAAMLFKDGVVSISVEAGDVVIRVSDIKNPTSHAFEHTLDAKEVTLHDNADIVRNFREEHFGMLLDGSYTVSLGAWKWAFLKHTSEPISYFIVGQTT